MAGQRSRVARRTAEADGAAYGFDQLSVLAAFVDERGATSSTPLDRDSSGADGLMAGRIRSPPGVVLGIEPQADSMSTRSPYRCCSRQRPGRSSTCAEALLHGSTQRACSTETAADRRSALHPAVDRLDADRCRSCRCSWRCLILRSAREVGCTTCPGVLLKGTTRALRRRGRIAEDLNERRIKG